MLKILYAGSPDVSAGTLKKLIESSVQSKDFQIVGVLTNPPARQGRSKELIPTPVALVTKELEQQYNLTIPVFSPEKLDANCRDSVLQLKPDLLVCFAYGKFFGPKFMDLFPLGGINLHPSLLPKYRGCAPVNAVILNMEKETGVTIQKLAQKMDSGNIISQVKFPLNGTETAEDLLETSAEIGVTQLLEVLNSAAKTGSLPPGLEQNEECATYSAQLCKEDGLIDWNCTAAEIDAKIRAFSPWPGAYTFADGVQLKIHKAVISDVPQPVSENEPGTVVLATKKEGIFIQTGKGVLCVRRLQWQAKKAMDWNEFMNGSRNFLGTRLGEKL